MKNINKVVLSAAALACAATLAVTPTASAASSNIYATVTWGAGSDCIHYDAGGGTDNSVCSSAHQYKWNYTAYDGQYIGLDPYIGNHSWVACTLYIDGRQWDGDVVDKGDGQDANCLFRLTH